MPGYKDIKDMKVKIETAMKATVLLESKGLSDDCRALVSEIKQTLGAVYNRHFRRIK